MDEKGEVETVMDLSAPLFVLSLVFGAGIVFCAIALNSLCTLYRELLAKTEELERVFKYRDGCPFSGTSPLPDPGSEKIWEGTSSSGTDPRTVEKWEPLKVKKEEIIVTYDV